MYEIKVGERVAVTVHRDGGVVFDPEYTAQDAARLYWESLRAAIGQFFGNYTEDGVDMVPVRLDGQELAFKNGYMPTAEALAFWQAVRETAPFKAKPEA